MGFLSQECKLIIISFTFQTTYLSNGALNTIKTIVPEVWKCELKGKRCTGERNNVRFLGSYRIADKSLYQRMVCDWIECELSLGHSTKLLNKEMIKDDLESVS